MFKIKEKIITFIPPENIEKEAMQQIENTATVPFLFKHVAVMPDTHFGKGSTVGTVLPTKGAVIPAAVGVDIGCGMIAVRTNLKGLDIFDDPADLKSIREGIERRIPMSAGRFNSKILPSAQKRITELEEEMDGRQRLFFNKISSNWKEQLGTLGGGNHFIELCLDENGTIWVTLHSGSRGIGNKIGMHYIGVAQKIMEKMFIKLPDNDLAYLVEGTDEFEQYLQDVRWAQKFALLNREEMMDRVLTEVKHHIGKPDAEIELERINCHHNFTQIENHFGENVWVTRKGAIQAKLGMKGMIPGSMGEKSYIVSGLENKMAFHSAPHGAGRKMSRNKARETFKMEDFDKALIGIEHRRSEVLLDEIPGAYKNIDEVMENAKELVKIEHTLKQFINVKGD